jgi:hypothetical protein
MTTIPPARFTKAYFRYVYETPPERGDPEYTLERERSGAAFKKTHREPRVLVPGTIEAAMVWNLISCTCCILSSKYVTPCENNNESTIEKVRQAKRDNKPYNLIFVVYKAEKLSEVDELIRTVNEISTETKVFLFFPVYGDPEELRKKGYLAISRTDMHFQTRYDQLVAEALGDEGIRNLEDWFGKKVAYYNYLLSSE